MSWWKYVSSAKQIFRILRQSGFNNMIAQHKVKQKLQISNQVFPHKTINQSKHHILTLYKEIQHSGCGLMANTALGFALCCICHLPLTHTPRAVFPHATFTMMLWLVYNCILRIPSIYRRSDGTVFSQNNYSIVVYMQVVQKDYFQQKTSFTR